MSNFKPFLFSKKCLPFLGVLLLCFLLNTLNAQPRRLIANHWYFGNHYGLDFSGGAPVVDHTNLTFSYEAASTMSDKEGNLLFYTNGGGRIGGTVTGGIWNRNHELMEGGDLGELLGGGYSAAQGALSIKKPGSPDYYYLFTVDELESTFNENNPLPQGKGLSYFEIDMSANGGLGEVVVSNQKLLTPSYEYLAGTIHGNCQDYWILARTGHRFLNQDASAADTFYLYRLTENGISAPLKTPITAEDETDTVHPIRFSPDGRYFIYAGGLYSFDKNTGEIGAPGLLESMIGVDPYFPMCFSSNGRFIYYFTIYNRYPDPLEDDQLFLKTLQFDLWAPNLFLSGATLEEIELPSYGFIGAPQLAPDGKLYIPVHYGVTHDPTRVFVINQPNVKGIEADFEGPVITLSHDENLLFRNFGNFTDDIFYIDEAQVMDITLGDDIEIPCDDIISITLDAPLGMDCYLWSDGSTTSSITVSEEGEYWVETVKGCAFGSDTITVALTNEIFEIDLGNDTLLCETETLELTAFFDPLANYLWQDGSALPTLEVSESGTYFVTANIEGCFDSDTIFVDFEALPVVDLGNDTTLCLEEELTISFLDTAVLYYQWQDGSDQPEMTISAAGNYSLIATNDCGIVSDQISVDFKDCAHCDIYIPNIFSPNFDGVNDEFRAYSPCEFDYFSLKIFNRWGGLLFEGNAIDEGWDGIFKNKKHNPGVFVFLLQYEFITENGNKISGKQSGDVTLVE